MSVSVGCWRSLAIGRPHSSWTLELGEDLVGSLPARPAVRWLLVTWFRFSGHRRLVEGVVQGHESTQGQGKWCRHPRQEEGGGIDGLADHEPRRAARTTPVAAAGAVAALRARYRPATERASEAHDVVGARLSPEFRDHVRRQVDPVHTNAPPAERDRDATSPDPSSSAAPVPARSVRNATTGSTIAGSNSSGHLAS